MDKDMAHKKAALYVPGLNNYLFMNSEIIAES